MTVLDKLKKVSLFQIIPQDDPKQALRLRRFFMALAMYALCGFLAYFSYLANIMEWRPIFVYLVGIPLINLILYVVFRTGLNLRLADPSLTSLQMCIAILVVMYGMYYANEARGLLLLVYILVFIFGIFRLNTRQFMFISVFSLLTYGINIILLHIFRPYKVNFHMEYLQWGILSLVLIAFSIVAGYISSMRQNLSTSRAELQKSMSIIRDMAIRDDLTGFYNRRHMMELIDYERSRCARAGSVFSLAMLDIDHFKNINDKYGHQAGDQTLKTFAAIIRKAMRSSDFCGRYGGEEFLIVLTQTSTDRAKVFAERLRQLIEKSVFPELGDDIRVTASLGLAQYQLTEDDVEKTIHRADTALYEAKKKGRNRVECCE